jgi:flagellar biogenesis protein FliO
MIKLFRNFHPLSVLPLFGLAVLLHIFNGGAADASSASAGMGQLYRHLLLPSDNTALLSFASSKWLGFILLFAQALLFNKVINTHNLVGKPSFLPGLLYIVCTSFADTLGGLSPVLLVNFVLIWLLNQFLSSYRKPDARDLIFDMGLLIGLGTILYAPFILFLLIVWVGLLIFRSFNWREWAMAVLGIATVAFFLAFYYYWNGQLSNWFTYWQLSRTANPISKLPVLVLMVVALIGILGLIQLRANFFRSIVHIRKSFQLLSALFGVVILSSVLAYGIQLNHYVLATVPLSVLLAYYFMHASKAWIYESLFILLLGSILYFQWV